MGSGERTVGFTNLKDLIEHGWHPKDRTERIGTTMDGNLDGKKQPPKLHPLPTQKRLQSHYQVSCRTKGQQGIRLDSTVVLEGEAILPRHR